MNPDDPCVLASTGFTDTPLFLGLAAIGLVLVIAAAALFLVRRAESNRGARGAAFAIGALALAGVLAFGAPLGDAPAFADSSRSECAPGAAPSTPPTTTPASPTPTPTEPEVCVPEDTGLEVLEAADIQGITLPDGTPALSGVDASAWQRLVGAGAVSEFRIVLTNEAELTWHEMVDGAQVDRGTVPFTVQQVTTVSELVYADDVLRLEPPYEQSPSPDELEQLLRDSAAEAGVVDFDNAWYSAWVVNFTIEYVLDITVIDSCGTEVSAQIPVTVVVPTIDEFTADLGDTPVDLIEDGAGTE